MNLFLAKYYILRLDFDLTNYKVVKKYYPRGINFILAIIICPGHSVFARTSAICVKYALIMDIINERYYVDILSTL